MFERPTTRKKFYGATKACLIYVIDDDIRYVRCPVNARFDPRYTMGTVKHKDGNVMIWGCCSLSGIGPLHWIADNMDQTQYRE